MKILHFSFVYFLLLIIIALPRNIIVDAECGNYILEPAEEECDGERLGGETCHSLDSWYSESKGMLQCNDDCQYDFSLCEAPECGDDIIEGHEDCKSSIIPCYKWQYRPCY